MALTVAQLVARLTADTSNFYRGMAIANSAMIRSGGIITRVAAGAGLATLGLGIMSLRAAGNFEQGMNLLQAISESTGKQMKMLRGEAIALGADFKLPNVSALDAANAMVELSKGGLSVNRILKATRGTLQLGLAANIDFAESAVITARALKAFNLGGSEATRVANVLAAGASKSTAEINDLAYGMQSASAQFHGANLSIEDLVASLGIMADRGLSGEYAGTALKTMLIRLTGPTDKAADVMKKFGIEVFNADGTMKSMPAVIREFTDGLGGLTQQQREQALITIFGVRANQAMRILMGQGADAYKRYRAEVTGTNAAQKIAEARTKGFNGALQAFGSAMETLAVELGTALLPAATQAVRAMARFVATIDPQKVIDFFTAIKNVVAAIYNFIRGSDLAQIALGSLLAGLTALYIVNTITNMVRAFTATILAMNAAMMANPVGLVIAALAALAAGLVIAYQKSETFRNVVNSVFDFMQAHWRKIVMGIAALIFGPMGAAIVFLITHWQQVKNVLSSVWNAIKSTAQSVWNAISDFFRKWWPLLVVIFTVGLAILVGQIVRHWDTIRNVTSTAWNAIRNVVSTAFNAVRTVVTTVANAIRSAIVAVWNAIVAITRAIWGRIPTSVREFIGKIPGILLGFVGAVASAAGSLGRAIVDGILGGLGGLLGGLKDKVGGALNGALGFAKGLIGVGSPSTVFRDEVGKPIGQGIIVGFLLGSADLPAKMKETMRKALESAKSQIDNYKSVMSAAFSQLGQDAMSAFDRITQRHLTPTELIIQQEEDRRAAERLQRSVEEAQASLAQAMAGGDPQAILDAQRRLDDALWEQRKVALEARAEQERLDYEARREMQKRRLQEQLTDLENALMRHPERHAFYQKKILNLLRSYGITYQTVGQNLGKAYAQGLRNSMNEIVEAARDIARAVSRVLKTGSPTKEGPMSDLDHWWDGFAQALVSGLDERLVRSRALALANAAGVVSGAGASLGVNGRMNGGGSSIIHVSMPGAVVLGRDRQTVDQLADMIAPALERRLTVAIP